MNSTQLSPGQPHAEMWPVMLTPFDDALNVNWGGLDALVEWYIENGADGLFAVSGSSEMYELTDTERFDIARGVVERCRGRVPVAASATFGGSNKDQADYIKRMADTGVSIAVIIACQIADEHDSNDVWMANLQEIMSLTDDIPLGIYECPTPYHRVLSPDMVREIAASGRFYFYKDTIRKRMPLRLKIKAASGSKIKYMNANSPTLFDSLLNGGGGYSGTGANFLAWHYAWLCHNYDSDEANSAKMARFLSISDMVVRNKYPRSSKIFLSLLGLPIGVETREKCADLTEEEFLILEDLLEASAALKERFGGT